MHLLNSKLLMKTLVNKKYLVRFSVYLLMIFFISCGDNSKETSIPQANSNLNNTFTLKDKKIFGVQSGIIEYEISGSQTGSRKLYFDDWGRKQAEYSNTTIKVGKYSKHSNLLKITNGNWQYIIDLDKSAGTKRENPILEKMFELKDQMNYGEFGEQLILVDGGFESGNEDIEGRRCRIYEFKDLKSKNWIWNWLLIKSEIQSGNVKININANYIRENIPIQDSVFTLPKNVLITEVDLKSLRNQTLENQF